MQGTDGRRRTDGTDARTDRRVSAPRAHGSRHRRTHCVCVTSFAANGRTEGTGDGGRKGGCFHGKVAVPPPSSVRPRPSLHLLIVVATAVVTVVVSAVVTAERSKARVSRSALNYVPSGRAREGGSRGERGSSQVERERDTRKGERTRATATDDCSLRERRTDGMRRRGGGGRRGGRGKRGGNCPAECVAEMSVGKEIYRRVAAAASDMLIIAARPPPARDLGCRRSRFLICDAETDRLAPVAARPPAPFACIPTTATVRSSRASRSERNIPSKCTHGFVVTRQASQVTRVDGREQEREIRQCKAGHIAENPLSGQHRRKSSRRKTS